MENEKTEKQCMHCGETFTGVEDQKYCSTSCRVMAYRKRKENPENILEANPGSDQKTNLESDPDPDEEIILTISEEDALNYKTSKVLDTILINDISVEILEGKRIRFVNKNNRHSVISFSEYNRMIQKWQNILTYFVELLTDQFARGKRSTVNEYSIMQKAMDLMENFGIENNIVMPYLFGNHPFHFFSKLVKCIEKDADGLTYSPSPDSTEIIAIMLQYIISQGHFEKQKL